MSVSYNVKGLMPITYDYKKRLEIYKSCIELKIDPPEEIRKYFEYDSEPCEDGIVVYLTEGVVNESADYTSLYYDVDLSQVPKGVTKLRFEVSY